MAVPRGPGRGRFLSTYDPARAKALIGLVAKNQTWQVADSLLGAGEWRLSRRPRALIRWRNMPGSVESPGVADVYDRHTKDGRPILLRIGRNFQAELKMGVNEEGRSSILAGTDTAAGVRVYPGFSLHEELN